MDKEEKFTPALGYHWLSYCYDIAIKLTMPERKIRKQLVELVDPMRGEKILELGFGTGSNLILLSQKISSAQFTGLDIDPRIKAIAKKKLERAGFSIPLDLYDGRKFPYANETFDKVFTCMVLHHLNKQEKIQCLKEMHRVLKPGGTIVIADFGKASSLQMRILFLLVQFLDGFKTTTDNVKGVLPKIISTAGYTKVLEIKSFNTAIGTFSYYQATKNYLSTKYQYVL